MVDRREAVIYIESISDLLHDAAYEFGAVVADYPPWQAESQKYLVNEKFDAGLSRSLD